MTLEISKILVNAKYKYSLNFRKEKGREIVCDATEELYKIFLENE